MRTLTLTLTDSATEAAFYAWLAQHPEAAVEASAEAQPDGPNVAQPAWHELPPPPEFVAEMQAAEAQYARGQYLQQADIDQQVWQQLG
jgi:hypothetical protein